jgi:Xaa-Pro aminopeptidase
MDHCSNRRQKLLSCLGSESLDALLITSPINVSYLTGFSGDSSYLVLGHDRTVLISDSRFTEQIHEECPDLETSIRPLGKTLLGAAAELLLKLGFRYVGFESMHLTVAELERLREAAVPVSWKGVIDRVEKLRLIKDQSEIGQIREAIRVAERAFRAFRACLRAGDSEKELADALEHYVRVFGGQCCSFPSIVAMGKRSALPHAPPTSTTLEDKELMLVDWGAAGRFYKSDLTRMVITRKNSAFSGPLDEQWDRRTADIYRLVLRAQQQAIAKIRPGVQGKEVDALARAIIAEGGYGDFFGHGLGHGLGLEVHEGPALRPGAENVLEAGMVVTVEPGIYLPEWGGIRIEDDVLVTEDGFEVLSSLPNDWDSAVWDL